MLSVAAMFYTVNTKISNADPFVYQSHYIWTVGLLLSQNSSLNLSSSTCEFGSISKIIKPEYRSAGLLFFEGFDNQNWKCDVITRRKIHARILKIDFSKTGHSMYVPCTGRVINNGLLMMT